MNLGVEVIWGLWLSIRTEPHPEQRLLIQETDTVRKKTRGNGDETKVVLWIKIRLPTPSFLTPLMHP